MATKNSRQQAIDTPATDTRAAFAAMYDAAKQETGWDDFIGNEEKADYARNKTRLWITGARIDHNESFGKTYLAVNVRLEHGATGLWGGLHMAGPNVAFARMLLQHFEDGGSELGPVIAIEREYTTTAGGRTQTLAAYSFAPAPDDGPEYPAGARRIDPAAADDDTPF